MKLEIIAKESGQALLELALIAATLCIIVLGIVDFGRAIYDVQVIKNLAGEGSSMASRGTSPATAASTVVNYAGSDLNMTQNGCVIVTVVTNQSGTLAITNQAYDCGIAATSKIGCLQGVDGCQSSTPTLPSAASAALGSEPNGSSLSVTEIYYNYSPITSVSLLLGTGFLPSQFYTAAYY